LGVFGTIAGFYQNLAARRARRIDETLCPRIVFALATFFFGLLDTTLASAL
jgi:hypothetical protein